VAHKEAERAEVLEVEEANMTSSIEQSGKRRRTVRVAETSVGTR